MAKTIPYNYSSFSETEQIVRSKPNAPTQYRVVAAPNLLSMSTEDESADVGMQPRPSLTPGWKRGLFWVSMVTSFAFTVYGGLLLFTLPNLIGQEIWLMLGVLGLLLLVSGGLIVVSTKNLRLLNQARLEIRLLVFFHLTIGFFVMLAAGLVLTIFAAVLLALGSQLRVNRQSDESQSDS